MLWIKALHIIAMVSWFAGLLYLPRLFVYHADTPEAAGRERFTLMEKRLYWRIMTPAMLLTILFGLLLLGYGFGGLWIVVKLLLVLLLLVYHASLYFYIKKLAGDSHPSARFFRLYNEVPTLLLIAIVILAIVKPL